MVAIGIAYLISGGLLVAGVYGIYLYFSGKVEPTESEFNVLVGAIIMMVLAWFVAWVGGI